ncbi:two-component regulator propeller domain-containing protein [Chitinophaga sp. sic0106]|uniref:hybrid sensor histidine kinase/response regulator transcription factor n=1 Tax=Chitinophaga sp. sic0106 TaxID=2854785 RepID=UPI001C48E788|nr:two-component regulator propeller domain-containing protein [Chitinophaga sp. sic0106]MBV7532126.1 response regulator [Chitinophaga sp. sic0106]
MTLYKLSTAQPFHFRALSTSGGIRSSTINAIIKDRFGLMWFATDDGLAQYDGTNFTVYRNKNNDPHSLPANEIPAIYEDRSGTIWIGTSGGSLSMYDRKHDNFLNFPAGQGPNSLGSNVVKAITSDHHGRIWVGHFRGLDIIDPVTKKITPFADAKQQAVNTTIICLFEDSRQRMWIGTNEGLFMLEQQGHSLKKFLHHPANPQSICSNVVRDIKEDKNGNIWVATTDGLCMTNTNLQGFTTYRHAATGSNSISSNSVNALEVDEHNRIWVGSTSGLDLLNPATGQVETLTYDKGNGQTMRLKDVNSIHIDKDGLYWVGTYRNGIIKYDSHLNLFNLVQHDPFNKQGLPASIVTSFAETANGKIYVGTDMGGVALFDPGHKTFEQLGLRSAIKGCEKGIRVVSLLLTQNNQLLVGTFFDGLFVYDIGTGHYKQLTKENSPLLNSNDIFSLTADSKGRIWIGTNGGGFTVLTPQLQLIARYTREPGPNDSTLPLNPYIRDIREDHAGNFWIATHGGGIARLDASLRHFTVYTTYNNHLPGDKIFSILEDKQGNIWVGSYGGGLGLLDKKTNQFVTFTEEDGLLNNNIYKILQDNNGLLWLSTNEGICSFDPGSRKFNNYTFHNSVQHNNFVRGSGILAANGTLYMGGLEGFNYFHPSGLKKNTNAPAVLFTDLRIANRSVKPSPQGPIKENISITDRIDLDYRQNFAISFVGLNYTAPEQNQYAYRLEGFEKDWNYTGNSNTAAYTNLDPGEYVLRVKVSNNDGVWNETGKSIRIIVHPPLWRTTYAYGAYLLVAIGLLLLMRYKGIQKVKKKFAERQQQMEREQERREAARIHELDRLKIKFITNLSHEFRTPISLILGPIDTLIRKEKNDHSFNQLRMIRQNGRRLLNLVNQLLDFRKLEEQELKLQVSDGEFIAFVHEATDSFRDMAERKKISLNFESSVHTMFAQFDHDKIERILFNLLSNAFKFTLEGGKIVVAVQKAEGKEGWFAIHVKDTGIGIPQDQHEKIFEHFFQHSTPAAIINKGTGIGLSITREFAKMHGGDITVDSEPGLGSTFTLTIPLTAVGGIGTEIPLLPAAEDIDIAAADISLETTPASAANADISTVLIVEDNDDLRFYLKDNLRLQYRVIEACNGKEGWQKALSQHPQLIVSDISMPYMDGMDLCKKIKGDKRTHHIPFILLTALTGEEEQLKGLETGANDYILKPFNVEILHTKIKNLLSLNNHARDTYSKQIKVEAPVPAIQLEDERLMNEITAYLDKYLTDTQLSVEALSKHVGMSRSSLYSKVLELTGQTPVEYIRSVKLEKAAVLLEKSDMNIAQVAYTVGFATPNYFARSFKAKYNMLPSAYIHLKRNPDKGRVSA